MVELHHPRHVVSYKSMRDDVLLMKDLNFNAVRCSHYPTDEAFYAICDELGMYVVDEANIETHGMGFEPGKTLAAKKEWEARLVPRNSTRRVSSFADTRSASAQSFPGENSSPEMIFTIVLTTVRSNSDK